MFITRKHLPRRTVLRGIGATLALPLLDAMIPAGTALAQTAAKPFKRMNFLFVAHGMVMEQFTPKSTGTLELSRILTPLAAHRDDVLVVSGLANKGADYAGAGHAAGAAGWLTGERAKRTEGIDVRIGVSVDQLAARQIGQETLFPSLELATEDFTGLVGACEPGFSCTYINTLSWVDATTPLPNEINPRVLFERLVGVGGTADERMARMAEDRSILDSMRPSLARLGARVGASDRQRLDDYAQNIREIERRIALASQRNAAAVELPEAPIGVPDSHEEHLKLMFDLQALAFQADLTRVATFILTRDLTNRTFPQIGVFDANHGLSHHQNDPAKLEKLTKVQSWQMGVFGSYLDTLKSMRDLNGPLLDNTIVLYGSSLSNSNDHSHEGLPLVVAGGGIQGGRHIEYPRLTPMSNLLMTLLEKAGGSPPQRFGDSTGTLKGV
jgi:hypothetical protein